MIDLKITLPESFLEEEVRDGYRVSKKMKEVWAVELDLLNEFIRVCSKYNICWWADAGTILGAARHRGMIPWDDDIDVMLMRDEYERLCAIAPKEFTHPYFFQTNDTDPGSMRGHAQLRNSKTTGILSIERGLNKKINQGIFIDIFPIDDVPNDSSLLDEQVSNIACYKERARSYWQWKTFVPSTFITLIKYRLKYVLTTLGLLFREDNYPHAYEAYENEARKYHNCQSDYVAKVVLPPFKPRRLWKRKWFSETIYLPFEWMSIPVPAGYVDLLDTFYGDWHKFVVGASTHGGVFFDTDNPYTEYIQ